MWCASGEYELDFNDIINSSNGTLDYMSGYICDAALYCEVDDQITPKGQGTFLKNLKGTPINVEYSQEVFNPTNPNDRTGYCVQIVTCAYPEGRRFDIIIRDRDNICNEAEGRTNKILNDSNTEKNQIKLYPNPFQNNLTIELNSLETGKVNITMIDMLGRGVLSEQHKVEEGKNQIDLIFGNDLQGGVYNINIQMEGKPEVSTHKVIHLDHKSLEEYIQNNDDGQEE